MHFIDQDEIEIDIPEDWDEKVRNAWDYVKEKECKAEEKVRDKAIGEKWGIDELNEKIDKAKVKARKSAISSKSIWSNLSDILAESSKSKCWYCETNEVRSDNPIDHFRPKNRVAECCDHPGYWWLAFDWKNYRYSCTYCNSRRVKIQTAGGKQDHFPLFTPPEWNKSKRDTNIERPMLLDPTDIDDCCLITFNKNGEVTPVSSNKDSLEYKKAEKSIELYHLNHEPTKRERKVIFQKIRELVTSINQLLNIDLNQSLGLIKTDQKNLIRLIRHQCKSTRFNSAARVYLKEYAKDNPWVKNILDKA
ncbi:MAG: hypothetical protein HAW67_07345 [Endozoicomonadaceae bacterium]|nr:hypothetical protein [Endozoicomonadaceae bacterium]